MDNYGGFFDVDAQIGVPDQFSQRAMLSEAVVKANRVHQELRDLAGDGVFADYVQYALEEAAKAAALLLTMHPKDERELFALQKQAAPYASVMEWIRKTLLDGADKQQQLDQVMNQEGDNAEED